MPTSVTGTDSGSSPSFARGGGPPPKAVVEGRRSQTADCVAPPSISLRLVPLPAYSRRAETSGFTLVELMVAMIIIALVATTVVVNMPDPRGRLIDSAESFAARARAAQQSAIIESRDMALWVSPAGYGFERHAGEGWVAVAARPFEDRQWPEGAVVAVPRSETGRTRVVFDSTGLNDPLDVVMAREGQEVGVVIGADGTIRVAG